MIIVGLGGLQNEPACAVLKDGVLASAVEQKKVSRRHEPGELPVDAIASALELARVSPDKVACVALVRPFAAGQESDVHLALRARFPSARLLLVEHHTAHAASVFFASPFQQATVLTLDRIGDFRCGARWQGEGNDLRLEKELYYPDSLGDLYGRVTELLGFRANADEHKVQWLSTSGDPETYAPVFDDIFGGGDWPCLDRSFFDANRISQGGFSAKFYHRLGLEDGAAIPESMSSALAAAVQRRIERTVLCMAGAGDNICLAGGLGYNALLVNALEQHKNVFVQPAAGNAGTAIGAVLHAWHGVYRESRRTSLADMCLGPAFSAEEIKRVLENCKLRFHYLITTEELVESAVRLPLTPAPRSQF